MQAVIIVPNMVSGGTPLASWVTDDTYNLVIGEKEVGKPWYESPWAIGGGAAAVVFVGVIVAKREG